jgi:hypothetical protein
MLIQYTIEFTEARKKISATKVSGVRKEKSRGKNLKPEH